jgi:hypothetical protein
MLYSWPMFLRCHLDVQVHKTFGRPCRLAKGIRKGEEEREKKGKTGRE